MILIVAFLASYLMFEDIKFYNLAAYRDNFHDRRSYVITG